MSASDSLPPPVRLEYLFLVRVWYDAGAVGPDGRRGSIEHTATGARRYFTDFGSLTAFIASETRLPQAPPRLDGNFPLIEAAALANLGNAERELGAYPAALVHMSAAIAIRESLGLRATFEELGDLALARSASGDASAAKNTAGDLICDARRVQPTIWFGRTTAFGPRPAFIVRAMTLPRAPLRQALHCVREQLSAIVDEESRVAFARFARWRRQAGRTTRRKAPRRSEIRRQAERRHAGHRVRSAGVG